MNKVLISISVSIFLLIFGCSAANGPEEGSAAPDFSLPDVDGQVHKLSEYQDSIVILHFWVDYCANCRSEFPKMETIYKKLKADGLEIVAVNVGQSKEHVVSFQTDFGITFPMLMDSTYEVAKTYQTMGFPISFIINHDGKIVKRVLGWMDETQIRYLFNAAK